MGGNVESIDRLITSQYIDRKLDPLQNSKFQYVYI